MSVVHLRHDGVRVVLADLSGRVLGERQRTIDVDHLPADSLAYVADAALEMVADWGRGMRRVIGMGVAVSAPVQRVSHALRSPSMLRDWGDVDIPARLRERVGVPVHVGNDANLGAIRNDKDPYLSYMKDYVWGSNSTKANQGNVLYAVLDHELDEARSDEFERAASRYRGLSSG